MPTREELWDLLRANGGQVRDSMSRKIDCLLVGTGYGQTKIDYARKHGILTVSLPMWDWLGCFEETGEFRASAKIEAFMPDLILLTSFCCEVLYAHSLGTGRDITERDSARLFLLGRMCMLAAGLESLLHKAYRGCSAGDYGEAPSTLIRSISEPDEHGSQTFDLSDFVGS